MGIRSAHEAESTRVRESFTSTEEEDLELTVNRYGIGADCHSRFYQVCALARKANVVMKYKDRCDAAYEYLLHVVKSLMPFLALFFQRASAFAAAMQTVQTESVVRLEASQR